MALVLAARLDGIRDPLLKGLFAQRVNLRWSWWNGTSAWATGKLWTQKPGCSPSYKCPYYSRWAGVSLTTIRSHIAPVKSANVERHDSTFRFTIPASVPGLAGTPVTVKVHDGGPGPAHDTYAHGVTGTTLTPYPIIGGPGVTTTR
jgi:hypothetical protein